jgi:hypothetical protein
VGLRATLPITAVLAVLAASCGSDSKSASTTAAAATEAPTTAAAAATTEAPASSAAPSSAPAAAASFQVPTTSCPADATTPLADGAPIKIGFMAEMSGPQGALGQDQYDALMLVVERNGGKLGGVPVEIIKEDSQLKTDLAQQLVDKLIEKALDEAKERTLSTEAEIARLEEELARLKGATPDKTTADNAGPSAAASTSSRMWTTSSSASGCRPAASSGDSVAVTFSTG